MKTRTQQILLVEDDPEISSVITEVLESSEYTVIPCSVGNEFVIDELSKEADLVICDLMLPGIPGDEIIERLRTMGSDVPVLVVSAKDDPRNKATLINLGADDFIGKPFDLDELTARVKALLRRAHSEKAPSECRLAYAQWMLDQIERSFWVDGSLLALTKTEFDIVETLMLHPRKVFTREELFEQVWSEPFGKATGCIDAHISHLRSKLKPSGTDTYIKTMWGVGFKLDERG